MRGKGAVFRPMYIILRITPAYAGKSRTLYAEAKNYEDHPRLCGEKRAVYSPSGSWLGSPPPMRGKVRAEQDDKHGARITPAYAGKSGKNQFDVVPDQDHPRLCGEKMTIWTKLTTGTGSPPPMRGKVPDNHRLTSEPRDHPRLCGEKHRRRTGRNLL